MYLPKRLYKARRLESVVSIKSEVKPKDCLYFCDGVVSIYEKKVDNSLLHMVPTTLIGIDVSMELVFLMLPSLAFMMPYFLLSI